jgi:signal transduction histidine kinase
LGHAELIQTTAGDALVVEDAKVVVDELMRLHRLADRLLLLAASEHPDFLRTSSLDVESTVVDTVRRWTPVERRWVLGDLDEAIVEADADRLALALDALIENAVKHTSPEDTITVSVRVRDAMAVIGVTDTGTGISREHLSMIFDRFARPDPARSREGGGVGLGLAIVKTVAEAHGGWVSVRSDPGEGSAFELALPISGAPPTPASAPFGLGSVRAAAERE